MMSRIAYSATLLALIGVVGEALALSGGKIPSPSRNHEIPTPDPTMTRQDVFQTALLGVMGTTLMTPQTAFAFDNRVSDKYSDRPKQRGSKAKDLGVAKRKDLDDLDHSIPAWVWPKDYDKEKAFGELVSVVESYEPGQNNVDGGGFKIMTNDPKSGYLYVQFESLKNGYIDDVEFAIVDGFGEERAVQIRSSSRLGYLDYGVNAIRLNFIATKLRAKGWSAPGVSYDTHQNYAIQNGVV
ncbi:MAG: hypothetical protein SGARI_002013 [Bacillariaceae sp.]